MIKGAGALLRLAFQHCDDFDTIYHVVTAKCIPPNLLNLKNKNLLSIGYDI